MLCNHSIPSMVFGVNPLFLGGLKFYIRTHLFVNFIELELCEHKWVNYTSYIIGVNSLSLGGLRLLGFSNSKINSYNAKWHNCNLMWFWIVSLCLASLYLIKIKIQFFRQEFCSWRRRLPRNLRLFSNWASMEGA